MKNTDLDKILEFMVKVDGLKEVKRTGWVLHKINKNPEHVADHAFSTALLSYIMARRLKLDANKCLLLALTHDIHEVITGDIATRAQEKNQVVSNKEKNRLENQDTIKMFSYLGNKDKKTFLKLWKEMKEQKSKESRLVKQIDALDYIIQTIPYSKLVKDNKIFQEFFLTAEKRVHNPEILYLYNKIKKQILKVK